MNNTNEIKFHNTLPINTTLRGQNCEYLIEKILGQGTFGITYLATVQLQGNLGRLPLKFHVTIKEFFMKEINGREESTVTSDSHGGMFDKYKRKFAQEARSLKSLNHPHIVKVMDFFEANNTYYYVMDYLCGGSIDDLIGRESYLSEDIAISYTRQIGEALGYMHENKILHLDMKPNNVMLNADGEAIVIDFGLSKQYDENGEPESSTTVGGGTVGYAPLEQSTHHDGKGFPVTMDVYALGATLYKMLVGVRAPEASSILNDGFPTQNLHQRNVSLETTKAIEKSMAPMKKDRFQSISEFINHLPKGKSNIHVVDVESESTTIDNNVVKSKKRTNKEKQILSLAEVINAADNAYGRKDYPTALKYYIEAFRRDSSLGEIAYTIGEIYYRGHDIQEKTQKGGGRYASMNDYYHRCQKANPWFQKAYDLGIDTSEEILVKAKEYYDDKDFKHYHKSLHECIDKNYKCKKALKLLIESYEKGIGCKTDACHANWLKREYNLSAPLQDEQYIQTSIRNHEAEKNFSLELNENNVPSKLSLMQRITQIIKNRIFSVGKNEVMSYVEEDNTEIINSLGENYSCEYDETGIFNDLNNVRIGDYVYEDGSFSHHLIESKSAVGVVFSTNPSEEDVMRGYSHGYFMALKDASKGTLWGKEGILLKDPFTNYYHYDEHYKVFCYDRIWRARNDYTGLSCIFSIQELGSAFNLAKKFNSKRPSFSSDWFLPSVGHWIDVLQNLGKVNVDDNLEWKGQDPITAKLDRYGLCPSSERIVRNQALSYWCSTQVSRDTAFVCNLDYGYFFGSEEKHYHHRIRCIAAF